MICNTGESAFATPAEHQIEVPHTVDCLQSILNVIVFQLMAYWLGALRENNIDFPRNVAKSVTVE
jgi:glucosamine--fructose-6-phosphate aminotransferase (isomerizing)